MEALLLQDGAYVADRYEELQDERRQLQQSRPVNPVGEHASVTADYFATSERYDDESQHWRIVERAKALDAKGPTPQLNKKFSVLASILERLYAENGEDPSVTSSSNGARKIPDSGDANTPVPFKELPLPTQVALKMFFRACQSLRDPTKLATNCRLSVQIASKLPTILTTMPSCVLSPGLVDDVSMEVEDGGSVWNVFYQLFQLFEELLGANGDRGVCLSASNRATVIVAYVALSLKWGRLGYLLKGVKLLLGSANELDGKRFEPLFPLFRELAATSAERPQVAFDEEEEACGYLMSFGKGDHGKLGHGQCVHVSCQEGNCTENKLAPTMIAATREVLLRKIDSLSTHSIAITAKGEAMSWGNGDKYRLGHGTSTKEYTPRTIEFLSLKGRVCDLACGLGHTLALMESGELFAWGNGSNGRLGLGDTNDRSSPTKVTIPTISQGKQTDLMSASSTLVRFRHIFCGASHSLGLSWDGRAYAWGKNNQGQCGHGHTNDQLNIQEIESFRDNDDGGEEESVIYAAGGWEHTLFCTASGRTYSCGCGYKDSRRAGIPPVLGHGDYDRRLKPTVVQTLDDAREEIVKVACGWDHSLAVSASGRVYTWGSGTNGKLGHGDEESVDTPTLVRAMEGKRVKDAKAGCEHTVFLTCDHELWSCGQGDSGRLGHGDSQTRKRPTKIELFAECGLKPVALAVGDKYNLVLVKDGDGGESETASIQKPALQKGNKAGDHVARLTMHHGRHRMGQHKKYSDSQDMKFGANWVLGGAVGDGPEGSLTSTLKNPDTASSAALFIMGHVDRLASQYVHDEFETHVEQQQESRPASKAQKTVLLPFAADTSYESLHALLQLLRLATFPSSTKEKTVWSEKSVAGGLCLETRVRMGLALSCLRVMQLNLMKALDTLAQHLDRHSHALRELFGQIHDLLNSLASLTGEDAVCRFDTGTHRTGSIQSLSAIGRAVSHEAAYALKMGFGTFYPTDSSRCSLLWEILNDCRVETPSMRTIILSDQLCKDSIMTKIFRCLPSSGCLSQIYELPGGMPNEVAAGKDIFEIKALMIVLLKRSSDQAIKHLDNEAFAGFTNKPDCFLRLLHVLQMHYFSILQRSVTQQLNRSTTSKDTDRVSSECQQMMESLLEYVDALMTEALIVLKKLHKGSRQHEEIITWRLNGSFFHTLLPSAIECLSVLLLPVSSEGKSYKFSASQTPDNLLLVERILPNLHVMLKMLDEVSWKMHSANDSGNQAHDDSSSTLSLHVGSASQERNWFVDLNDACAVLCGKLSCELFYPSTRSNGTDLHGSYASVVSAEGWLLREDQDVLSTAKTEMSNSIQTILNWESLGVFEVEDEVVGCEEDPGSTAPISSSSLENQRFLYQFNETDFSTSPLSFWSWIAAKFAHVVEFTAETERLLTLVLSVSAWHLELSEELRLACELFETASQNSPSVDNISAAPTGRIWEILSILLAAVKRKRWICDSGVANAIKLSRLLLSLQPNPVLVPPILRREVTPQDSSPFWAGTDDPLSELLEFLINTVDVDSIRCSLFMKDVHESLSRTGICILHDLLRKLTTSSAKSCLLDEFVAVICSSRQPILHRKNGKRIDKAVENLFVRLARVVASDDASFVLKKKALMAWTVPLNSTKQNNPNVVALIAKSGIMTTLVELLLNEANVLDTHCDVNACGQLMTADNTSGVAKRDDKLPTNVAPINSLLFDQTPAQVISVLAWETFCAVAMQFSKSERFAEIRLNLLCSAGPSLHERDTLTPRTALMSPRRRLTLPKKMVISSMDEIIEQMTDGLFLMLKGAKKRLDALDISSEEFSMLLRPAEKRFESKAGSDQQQRNSSSVFLFGRPVQTFHSTSHEIEIPKSSTTSNASDSAASLTLSFWIYVEHTGAVVSKQIPSQDSGPATNPQSKRSAVRLIEFGTGEGASSPSESTNSSSKGGSLIVFTREAHPDYVSIGLAISCAGEMSKTWCSIVVDERVSCGKWIQISLGVDKDNSDSLQVIVGARHSTLNNGKQSDDSCKLFCSEFLQNGTSWRQLSTGGNVDLDVLENVDNTSELLRLSIQPKTPNQGFVAVLDDVIITRGALPEESVCRMQSNGPVLFRLKQWHIAEMHCVNVLRLLCQLVGDGEADSSGVLPASLPFSDRWLTLFAEMLQSTCQHHYLAQVYLCHLLQIVLPRAPPLPEFDVQALGRKLFSTRRIKSANLEELFNTLHAQSHLPSTSTIRRHNEALYRALQQIGVLHGRCRDASSSDSLAPKAQLSMRFAAGVHLFQKLCSIPSWRSSMDRFRARSSDILRCAGGLNEILESEEIPQLAEMTAVVSTAAGYSEQAVNAHRAAVRDSAMLPASFEVRSSPFDSVAHFDDNSTDQALSIQALIPSLLKEETQQALCLPGRKDIIAKYHNDVTAINAIDMRIGTVVHQRARVLRVLMATLLREQSTATTSSVWHHFLLESTAACDDLLQVATAYTKECVLTMLGPDAKTAMKLRRLRIFIREVLRGAKRHRQGSPVIVSLAELESFQWLLWEEMASQNPSVALFPWWQQNREGSGKLSLEVVGGDVELCELRVKALEHFPTVRLAQANIGANSGLWFYEVVVLTEGLMQIGYVDGDFTADPLQGQGVGDHTNSWAFDGFRCKKWNGNSYDYGEQWRPDDVVGVMLDSDHMEISYFLNGKFLGIAFSKIPITANSRVCPAASLNVHQSAEFNFGTPPSEDGLQSLGFKYLPVLDSGDQTRLRPIVLALQTGRTTIGQDSSTVGRPDKGEAKENDASDGWSSSDSGSETDDGEIALEGTDSFSGLRRALELTSQDGRETSTTDQNDDETVQRRRHLVEGLTGLGFPLEWATRCATETHLPMDETSAVAWILEQMGKVGLDGAPRMTSNLVTDDDGMEHPSHPGALLSTQLPNLVGSHSADALATFADTGASIPLARIGGDNFVLTAEPGDTQLSTIPTIYMPASEKLSIMPAEMNVFIEADKEGQQSDDATNEAFESNPYSHRHVGFSASLQLPSEQDTRSTQMNALETKGGMDDLIPLSIAVDTTVYIAYTRQAFTSLLLLALLEEKQETVYRMIQRVISSEESSARLHRFLRQSIGLDPMDVSFELGYVSDNIHSEMSLQLQRAAAMLLKFEAQNASERSSSPPPPTDCLPLLQFFCKKMTKCCDRGLILIRNKRASKNATESFEIQAAAPWFAWISGLVIGFVEDQISSLPSSPAAIRLADFAVPCFSDTSFVENLVIIASSKSSLCKAWRYVAFRLITRILFVVRTIEAEKAKPESVLRGAEGQELPITPSDTLSEYITTAQLGNLAELFALRRRREMYNRVFCSDITNALFTLLVRTSDPLSRVDDLDKRQHPEAQRSRLHVNNFSSTHVTISWDQVSRTTLASISTSCSGNTTEEPITETRPEIDSSIMFLDVERCGSHFPGCGVPGDTNPTASKALPSKGTFTIRNLFPDTQYRIRLSPAQPPNGDSVDVVEVPPNDSNMIQGAEVILQTPPEPVFELDQESMGKNLVIVNRNLTAKNTVNKKWHSVRASVAFDEGVHQWQVRLDTCVSKNIFIGVCTADASMDNYIGSDAYGYGFLANKAVWHNKAKLHSYGEIFKQGDVIQVTLDCNAKTLAFSRNGEYLGIAASNIHAGPSRFGSASNDGNCKWYPAFSMYNKDDKVTLVPPPTASMFKIKEGRPQNASTFELIEAMQDVLAYQTHLTDATCKSPASTKLFEKAFEEFEDWRREEKVFREISLGQVITIDKSKSATDKYGLATGDSVFTSKGQCTVLGEYRHELWYEEDDGSGSALFSSSTPQLASWSLSTCREMLASPDEYPVHRHHKYQAERENTDSVLEQQSSPAHTTEHEEFSFQSFVTAQVQWSEKDGIKVTEADARLIAELDTIASSQALSSSLLLSFADISVSLLLEKNYDAHGISAEVGNNRKLARIGLLLYVNRCLYNVVRVTIPRNTYATSLRTCESPDLLLNSTKQPSVGCNTECHQVSPIAALLNSPYWALEDQSAFTRISALAARLLFSSQKEKLIDEELRMTKTASRELGCLQESGDNEDGAMDTDLPVIKIRYPPSRAIPFWECSSAVLKSKTRLWLPLSAESSVFAQLSKQLAAQDPRQWRRESSQPFEAIPVSQTFHIHIEKQSTESSGEDGKEADLCQQQQDEDDDDSQLQQPTSKQTAKYLNIFESAVREAQSPCFPLFAPVEEARQSLRLDINVELFSPSALAHSRVQSSQLLLWYYCFGQLLGVAWRSKLLLPMEFISKSFWKELVSPSDPLAGSDGSRSTVREAAIRAIRDGLFSIIPSRCVALLSGSNPSIRDRLTDLDVNFVARLERHATYSVPSQNHHKMFWTVVNAFTSVERRMLEQFVNPERRTTTKQFEVQVQSVNKPSNFVLEIADALADGRDHPDSCYPVVVAIGPYSSRLHLPSYSSSQTLRHKLLLAMTNTPFM